MAKPPKQTTIVIPTPSPETASLKRLGIINYFGDIADDKAALESLSNPQDNSNCVPSPTPPATTIIDRKDGVYHVYLHSHELTSSWWVTNLNAFTQWAMSLSRNDVVYFNQTGHMPVIPPILQAMVVLDTLCLAQKVFIVDHIIETPLLLLVCNNISIQNTGAISFGNYVADDARKCEQTMLPYMRRLYARAVTRGLLTEEEVASILNDNAIVFKTARQLRQTQVST